MNALRELQLAFSRPLDGDSATSVERLIVTQGIPAPDRVAIYRHNVRATFHNTMQIGFPATARRGGAEFFRQLVTAYQGRYPSRSGNLQHVGADFSAYVADRFDGSRFEYLKDGAAIEWAYQEVLIAPDHAPFDVNGLAVVPETAYGGLRLRLHPAARLLRSRFPLTRIWRANRDEPLDMTPIDLDSGGDRILLLRRGLDVEIHRLDVAEHAFLEALARGETLVEAIDAAANSGAGTDPVPMLGRYATQGVIVHFVGDDDAHCGTCGRRFRVAQSSD